MSVRHIILPGFLWLALLSGCHSPNQPSGGGGPAPVASLTLECPSDIQLPDATAPTSVVSYSAPGYAGGVEPIGIVCSPSSGAEFPIGTTSVSCNASDAATPPRTAICRFNVVITPFIPPIPTIRATKFLAFGDSLTLGENGCNNPCNFNRPADHDYPTILGQLLTSRYTQQTLEVINRAEGGETAADGAGRIDGVLKAVRPDVLLLLEGVNDFAPGNGGTPGGVISALRDSIRSAKAAGVTHIFLSNLLPEIEGGSRAYMLPIKAGTDLLAIVNPMIRDLASQENVYFVDSFSALNQNLTVYISAPDRLSSSGEYGDGLHVTKEGGVALANVFFAAIQQKLEGAAGAMGRRR